MSVALIEESAKEVRRLAIAGSPLAVGDFRLKKLVAPLEQAGAKAPVFAQVAKAISDLVNGTEAESAMRLLNLSTLLNAILYTQGETSTNHAFQKLEAFPTNCNSTRTTARVLRPLVEALSSSGGGRFEIIKSAVERGAFNDLRLIDPAIRALGDNYAELADLVADKILPGYGPGIIPRLRATFELKGKKQDARKLEVMHRLDPAGTIDLCKKVLEDGSAEVKITAIGCLGKHEECLPLVLEQAESKNKQVRAAALEALAAHDRPEITKVFTELVKGKTLDILVGPFRALRNRQVLNSLLDEGRKAFELLLKGNEEQVPRFVEILECLKGHKETATEEFMLVCFERCDKLPKFKSGNKSPFLVVTSGDDILDRMSWVLYEIGSPKTLEAVLAKRNVLPAAAFVQILYCALLSWPKEKVFREFACLLEQTKGPGKQKSEILQQIIKATSNIIDASMFGDVHMPNNEGLRNVRWDDRWLDAAIKADQAALVSCLARPNHKAALDYLLKLCEGNKTSDAGLTIRALVQCEYPKVTDRFLDLVASKTKNARYLDYELQFLFGSARHLPPADLPKLDEFAAKLDEKYVDAFLVAINPLRQSNNPN